MHAELARFTPEMHPGAHQIALICALAAPSRSSTRMRGQAWALREVPEIHWRHPTEGIALDTEAFVAAGREPSGSAYLPVSTASDDRNHRTARAVPLTRLRTNPQDMLGTPHRFRSVELTSSADQPRKDPQAMSAQHSASETCEDRSPRSPRHNQRALS